MKQLKKAAQSALASSTVKGKVDSLSKAFEIFSKETLRLESAYDSLNRQFQTLNFELQDTNHKLQSKVAELDITTDYLRSILENIAQGILFIDLSGIVTTYNKAAESILGISSKQALFKSFWDSFSDDVFGFSMREALEKMQASTNSAAGYTKPDATHYELEVVTTFALKSIDPIRSDSRYHTQGMIVMIRDVTEMRQLQLLAARADRMKILGEMAAQVAHEIRNPLGGIKGYASLLQRDLAGNPELQNMASHIVEGTDSLNRLVSQVLYFARPVHPHMERTELIKLIREVKEHVMTDAQINSQLYAIDIDACAEELYLSLDMHLFKSALLNLIVNAIQAMPEGGEIYISVRENPRYIIISFSDTGIGISEENMTRLYSPFFTTKPEGNGLGLTEVQKVVQAHGGTIDATSTIGKGTTFVIKLPTKGKCP